MKRLAKRVSFLVSAMFLTGIFLYAEEAPQQFEGFNLAGYGEGGKKTWDVKGDTADILGNIVKLTNIVANAYGEEDDTNLTARSGTMDKETGNMHLEKDVVITTSSGTKLTTDSLDWAKDKDLVVTKDLVTIEREGMTATGTGAEGHPSLKIAQMNEDVTVKIDTQNEKEQTQVVTITCDGPMNMEYNNQKAIFNNNVVAVETDRKLKADKMEIYFDTVKKEIKQMVCTGNVEISQGANITYSDSAVYNAVDKTLTLSGSPKLVIFTEKGQGLSFNKSVMDEIPKAEPQITDPIK